MKATQTQLTKFLDGTKQFIIPIYQRTYRWETDQCRQLWKDIVKAATDDKIAGHFIGSIVYIEKGLYQTTSPSQLLVIDGHQRLTTISLLLIAMSRRMKEQNLEGEINHKKIMNYYLLNNDEDGELRYKLLLTRTDKSTLINLIDDVEIKEPSSRRIIQNYQFFKDQIKESKIDMPTLYTGIKKLLMVDISLDRNLDNPQRIFESMNSTGLDLSQADLIRNYVLMGREVAEQEKLYNNYWYPMEQSFGQDSSQDKYSDLFNRFMRDYLTLKTRDIPSFGNVYEAFKSYVVFENSESFETLLADVFKFSKYYVGISREQEKEKDLREMFRDINELRVEVAFPFLLEVYDDYSKGILKLEEFKEILTIVESFVFRRAICGIPTNALNLIFAEMGREIDKEHYLESFKALLLIKDKYKRYPDDDEFKNQLMIKDLYHFPRRNYWLRKLENYQHKERIIVEDYTIEHVMPQDEKLSPEWIAELGENWKEIHKKYLHTLGNLTLTGYNSELSKRPFKEKRDMKGGFKDSHLLLNHDLATLEHWNEQEIVNRANRLAELATKVWIYPSLPADVIRKYIKPVKFSDSKVYTLANYPHACSGGANENLFQELRKRILNLDASVTEEILKIYIAYKTDTNFVDVVPLKSRLDLTLNVKFGEIQDPKGLCKDVTGKGKWGNGDVNVWLTSPDQLDDVMALIKQSFEKHTNYDNQ
jgi:uncharacterized protein with ParB-like and HNH nuclease domain/predicted transport protein